MKSIFLSVLLFSLTTFNSAHAKNNWQVVNAYGNPDVCLADGPNEKVGPLIVGEVCPEKELYYDKYICEVANQKEDITIHLTHRRITEVTTFWNNQVFHGITSKVSAEGLVDGLKVADIHAPSLEPTQIVFNLGTKEELFGLPIHMTVFFKDGRATEIYGLSCTHIY